MQTIGRRHFLVTAGAGGLAAAAAAGMKAEDQADSAPPSAGEKKSAAVIPVQIVRNPPRHRPPCPFVVDDYYRPEVSELRTRFELDKKVEGARDRWEALLRLSHWLGSINRFGTPPERVPQDARCILDAILKKGWNFECSFMPAVMGQVAHAMGYGARDVWCGYNGELFEGTCHHGSTEIWVDGLDRWVYVDALHSLHFERNGVPLGILELHQAAGEGRLGEIEMVRGQRRLPMSTAPEPAALNEVLRQFQAGEIPSPHPTSGLFFWFLVSMHNAWFANRQHNHEMWGRVLFYRDRHNAEKTWFQRIPPDTGAKLYHWAYWSTDAMEVWSDYQVNFPLNQVHIDWQEDNGHLGLSFETTCPNFAAFEVAVDGQAATDEIDPSYTWRLHPGENRLTVRTRNLFGVRGTPSELKVVGAA